MRPGIKQAVGRVLVGAFVAALGLAACEAPPASGTGAAAPPAGDANIGSVSLELTVGSGNDSFTFDQVSYDISGNGFQRSAVVDVSASTSFSTVVSGIPFGTGYSLTLTAQDTARKLTPCQGSATFDVTSATVVPVAVDMTCHELITNSGPPAVPVPRPAIYALGALLLALGAGRVRERPSTSSAAKGA